MGLPLADKVRNSYRVQQLLAGACNVVLTIRAFARRFSLRSEIARRSRVNIHFGCGEVADDRFLNVDARPMPHVHHVTRSPMLRPFPMNSADTIYACHVFEHLGVMVQQEVLRRWLDILKPGGRLMLSVPDFDKLVDRYLAEGRNPLSIQPALMGGQDYPGNFHFAIFTAAHLERLLEECGFVEVTSWHPRDEQSWPRDWSWADWVSLNISARKPD